jgi:hypothetical protein
MAVQMLINFRDKNAALVGEFPVGNASVVINYKPSYLKAVIVREDYCSLQDHRAKIKRLEHNQG